MSSKIRIGIIGAGRAGFIKQTLAKNAVMWSNCKEFSKEWITIKRVKFSTYKWEFTIDFNRQYT
jgi:hypothetical protein